MRSLLRLLHWYFLARAVARGPRYFAGYEVRRQTRRAAWRATRNWGRPHRRH
jgi:hypothetical protein